MPVLGEVFLTCEEGVAHYRRAHGKWVHRRLLAPPAPVPTERALISITQRMVKMGTFRTKANIHAVAVAIYPMLKILEGCYKAYIGKLKLWDIAGALPMVQRLGLESRLLRGPFQCEGERDHLGSLLFRQLSLDLDLCLQKSLI